MPTFVGRQVTGPLHDVYFGSSFNDVNDANESSPEFQGNQAEVTFDPGSLAAETTYYWRIDERGPFETIKGDVWSFTTWKDLVFDPISWWKFDETGNIAFDSAGDNDCVLTNGVVRRNGVSGASLQFDGVNDHLLGTTSPFNFENTSFTVSGWFSTATVSGTIIAEGAYGNGGWYVAVLSGNITIVLKASNTSNAYTAISTEGYADGLWHHVVAVITTSTTATSGNHADVYVDGVLVNVSETKAYAYAPSNQLISIGARAAGTAQYFAGSLDEIMVFARALTAHEVEQLYQRGQQRAYAPSPRNGVSEVDPNTNLSWSAGFEALSHDIYFGSSFEDVNDANESSPEFKGNQTATAFDPNTLSADTTYYWRIDERGAAGTVKGDVWSFTTWKDLVLDPF